MSMSGGLLSVSLRRRSRWGFLLLLRGRMGELLLTLRLLLLEERLTFLSASSSSSFASSSSSSPSDVGGSEEASSERVALEEEDEEDEEDESGENKDGRFNDGSSEGMTSPSSFADARAPTGSAAAAVKRAGGEEDRGRGGAERVGRRTFPSVFVDGRLAA